MPAPHLLPGVDSLLEQLHRTADEHGADHKALLTDFVEPLYETFKDVSRTYVQTYRGYQQTVSSWTAFRPNIEAFCQQLHHDHDGLRTRMSSGPGSGSGKGTRPVVRNFVGAIGYFLQSRLTEVYFSNGGFWPGAVIRPSVMEEFKKLAADSKRNEAELIKKVMDFIEDALNRIEGNASTVDHEYEWQRTKLLR